MIDPTPDVNCKYGAPMGRRDRSQGEMLGRVYLRKIVLDSGGYDKGGAYWGHGLPLWYAEDEEGDGGIYFRAPNRDAAKAYVLSLHPTVKFFR